MSEKFALYRVYRNVPIARSVANMLADTFPEYQMEIVDIASIVRRRPFLMVLNTLATGVESGNRIVRHGKRVHAAFMATNLLFHAVRHFARHHTAKRNYAFTFQLQSLFDTSSDSCPHFVYTDHTHLVNLTYPAFDPRHLHNARRIRLEKQVYNNATHVFSRSSNVSRSIVNDYGAKADRVTTAYVGVNTSQSRMASPPDRFERSSILFVGIDWERKGGVQLLAAFGIVLERYPDASLTIIGCNPKTDLPNVRVLGKLSTRELQRHYLDASIFCLPTRLEPFGVVFVEAMTYGLPIVATSIGAIPDMVTHGQNGLLVAPDDIEGLANSLTFLLENPSKCRAFGECGRQRAGSLYNWQNVGSHIREVIDQNVTPPNPAQHTYKNTKLKVGVK